MVMGNILEIRHLRVSYHTYGGEVQAVRDVSFSLKEQEILALVGESGCGKSITAKSIMGLIKQPPGEIKQGSEIKFEGQNIFDFNEKRLRAYRGNDCAIIFQDPLTSLNPTMMIGQQIAENLLAHTTLSRASALEKSISLLDKVGIREPRHCARQYPHELSGGMRQRVMIAIAFACQPKLLIADEPTTALDVTIQSRVIELIKELHQEMNISVILITHDLGVVANIAQSVVVMYAGVIVEKGSSCAIFYRAKHPYTQALLASIPRLDMHNKQHLPYIKGSPPDLVDLPEGCPFAERCIHAMNICWRTMPTTTVFAQGHEASCWLYHPAREPAAVVLNRQGE